MCVVGVSLQPGKPCHITPNNGHTLQNTTPPPLDNIQWQKECGAWCWWVLDTKEPATPTGPCNCCGNHKCLVALMAPRHVSMALPLRAKLHRRTGIGTLYQKKPQAHARTMGHVVSLQKTLRAEPFLTTLQIAFFNRRIMCNHRWAGNVTLFKRNSRNRHRRQCGMLGHCGKRRRVLNHY